MPLGIPELLLLLAVVVLLFGARKLPELGRGLGSGMKEFKEGISSDSKDEPVQIEDSHAAAPATPRPAEPAEPAEPRSDDGSDERRPGA